MSEADKLKDLLDGDRDLHLLYGSQSGNAEGLCNQMAKKAPSYGLVGHVHNMEGFELQSLKGMKRVLIACSTWGEGDQPDNAAELYTTATGTGKILSKTSFSVCALGDTSYEFFCKSGKEWDEVLEKMGGARIHDRVDCDVEFDEPANAWMAEALKKIACVDDSGNYREDLVETMSTAAANNSLIKTETAPEGEESASDEAGEKAEPVGKPAEQSPPENPDEFKELLSSIGVESTSLGLDKTFIETLEIAPADLVKSCEALKEKTDMDSLVLITSAEVKRGFQSIYLLQSIESRKTVRIKVTVSRENPEVSSVTHLWKSANWYEREAYDMMGIKYTGHPELKRILNPEDWEGFPLRKDYIPPSDSLNGPHPLSETKYAEDTLQT